MEIAYMLERGYEFVVIDILDFVIAMFPLLWFREDYRPDATVLRQLLDAPRAAGAPPLLGRRWVTGQTSLYLAAVKGAEATVVKLLHAAGEDVNAASWSQRMTPLHAATANGFVDTVRALLECRADASLKESKGWTALGLAKAHGRNDVVALLSQM